MSITFFIQVFQQNVEKNQRWTPPNAELTKIFL